MKTLFIALLVAIAGVAECYPGDFDPYINIPLKVVTTSVCIYLSHCARFRKVVFICEHF